MSCCVSRCTLFTGAARTVLCHPPAGPVGRGLRCFILRRLAQALAAAVRRGEPGSDDDRFDSNCITPGTAFMARLGAHLRFFIRKKMAEDPVWQQPRVIFSGTACLSSFLA